jgi:hypothetical protein
LDFCRIKDIRSNKVPNGQIVEQYTLPNKTVKIKTIRKPPEIIPGTTRNFKKEGKN